MLPMLLNPKRFVRINGTVEKLATLHAFCIVMAKSNEGNDPTGPKDTGQLLM